MKNSRRSIQRIVPSFLLLVSLLVTPLAQASAVTVPAAAPQSLDFAARVACQQAIEAVYWEHREWPAANQKPKPALATVMPAEAIRAKALDGVAKSNALETIWRQPLTGELLQAEINRMVQNSKRTDLLKELFAALDHDPRLVAECLARPLLADRLIRDGYASTPRLTDEQKPSFDGWWVNERLHHGAELAEVSFSYTLPPVPDQVQSMDFWRPTQSLPDQSNGSAIWTGTEMIVWGGGGYGGGGKWRTGSRYSPATDTWTTVTTIDAPLRRSFHTVVWTGGEMIVWGGCGPFSLWLCELQSGARYNPLTDTWTPVSIVGAPSGRLYHTAVWTGDEMIVWGGCAYATSGSACYDRLDAGRYDPSTDSWSSVTMAGGPSPRSEHAAVWTGSRMLVWGGDDGLVLLVDGGLYDPTNDSWSLISATGAPTPRSDYSAVWTGQDLVVWGGCAAQTCLPSYPHLNTGARYHLDNDTWTALPTAGAPSARYLHTAVWTGEEMIVWGGSLQGGATTNTGGRYDPVSNTWTGATSVAGAPSNRSGQRALWTGSEMIIWGSDNGQRTGGRYNPSSDSWTPTNANTPQYPLSGHEAVWTGTEMLVWGGDGSPTGQANLGDRYDPATDTWTPLSSAHSLFYRYAHTAVWTGSEMIVWGGQYGTSVFNDGARYNPMTDSWTSVSTVNAPDERSYHTAVWTGSEMIIWGGQTYVDPANTGARYDPASDLWTATSTANAPSGRYIHTAVWTGTEMIVWGGAGPGNLGSSTGGRYDPGSNTWTATSAANAPAPRYFHTAVWMGSQMIVFGGRMGDISSATYYNTGGRYDPAVNTWLSTSTADAPSARSNHTAVWTGDEMIIWGGCSGGTCLTETYTGARYDPAGETWTTVTLDGVPSVRSSHSAVWTGDAMIVWGGVSESRYTASGAFYFRATCAGYDLNCDGNTDLSDIILVANRWNCQLGAACYVDRYDLNGDNAITVADAMIVAGAWSAP